MAPHRELEPGVAYRGAHPFAGLLHCCVRQPHHDEVRQAGRGVHLHLDDLAVESGQRTGCLPWSAFPVTSLWTLRAYWRGRVTGG